MSQILLWKDDVSVDLQCEEQLITGGISQLCFVDPYVCVISKNSNELHYGSIEGEGDKLFLKLEKSAICAVSIASSNSKELLYVCEDGRVFSTHPGNLDDVEEVTITEEAKCCIHGHSTPRQQVQIKSIATSEQGTFYLSKDGTLWASGSHPHLDVKPSDGIKRVNFFLGRKVEAVASGLNFSVALVYKREAGTIEKDNSNNDIEDTGDVFVSGCPKCFSESIVSLPSHHSSSDICPLGLPLRKYSIDHSTSSTTSKENNEKKSIDGTTSPSTEDEVIHRSQTSAIYNHGEKVEEVNEDKDKETIIVNGEKEEKTESGESEGEKKNSLLLNTEAARQFLTRQLSWVSSYGNVGEEFLAEYTEGTTRLVKQNVSNVANLVYEGVRTVGDKVATLSRHVSGGSDSCTGNEDSFEELILEDFKPSNASCFRFEDFLASSSAATSDHEGDCDLEAMDTGHGCEQGLHILGAELYSWGSVNHGQLGVGDCVKRDRPTVIAKLSGTGIHKVYCGMNHSVALTLDGRMFAWGANGSGQVDWRVCPHVSSPAQVLCGSVSSGSDRTWDIACGNRHSLMLTHGGDIFFLGKHRDASSSGPVKLHMPHPDCLEEGTVAQKQMFAHGPMSWCAVFPKSVSTAVQDLALEQSFLEECLLVQFSLIRPFLKRIASGTCLDNHEMFTKLCSTYTDVLSFSAFNAFSLLEYAKNGVDASAVAMVQNVDDHVRIYKNFLEAACNVLSVSGFSSMANVVEPPPHICELFADRLPPLGPIKKGSRRNANEATFACAILHPLSRLNVYKCILQSLMRSNNGLGPHEPQKLTSLKKLQIALSKWELLCDESDQKRKEAETTRRFWESAGRALEAVRTPVRRLVRESRTHHVQVMNSGRFSSHWIILLNDVLVHVAGSTTTVHPLSTLWVEPLSDDENSQGGLSFIMPEETLLVHAASSQDKSEWLQALQTTIRRCLCKPHAQLGMFSARHASYTFTKVPSLKDAKYIGRWLNGKMQGWGSLEWPDGRLYVGQFVNNVQHGYGRANMPNGDHYEGQWRDGLQNGRGVMKYAGGDVYDGHFKDGLPHGHGTKKEGHFTASVASLYIGEWFGGVKQGYGVMDNIFTGEKYLGCWSNNVKHGCGIIVTLDGIYYEGVFMQDVLTGHGVMVFEDGTHYEGEFKSAGCFNGKGTLTLNTGDYLEGTLQGMWNEGVKVAGTLFKNPGHSSAFSPISNKISRPSSFGKLCVPPNQKWKSIFRQCLASLAVPPFVVDLIASGTKFNNESTGTAVDSQRLWASVAVSINTSLQEAAAAARANSSGRIKETLTDLDKIPEWGRVNLSKDVYHKIHQYLVKAFESTHHPLGLLFTELSATYTATYGGVRVHPLLLSHAVAELHSLVARIYEVVRLLFPALPVYGQELILTSPNLTGKDDNEEFCQDEGEVVSASTLLHPFVLPRVHAALFVLYALNNKAEDDAYWKRLLKWNKQPDLTLLAFLGIDQKFWCGYSNDQPGNSNSSHAPKAPFSPMREQLFTEAVETLQQLKTTFSPLEKLLVIRNTFEQLTQAVKKCMGSEYLWTMDELFPVFHFVVVRSRILQLGSEINFIEDFMERHLQNGELGIMFTTLKACYYQILQEKISLSS